MLASFSVFSTLLFDRINVVKYSLSKTLKRLKKYSKKFVGVRSSVFVFTIGLVLLIFGGLNYYRLRILSFTSVPIESTSAQKGELPVQITIPSLKIDQAIEAGSIKDGVWQISYQNATFLNSSARPGTGGNVVIYGHNKKAIFGNLPYLSLGQKIYIKTQDGQVRVYEAYKKEFVKPSRVDLIAPTDNEELTLYTCWGLFDSQRVVIKAKPI
jgi:LPXTG-site transpeptidase (sortase) family protein